MLRFALGLFFVAIVSGCTLESVRDSAADRREAASERFHAIVGTWADLQCVKAKAERSQALSQVNAEAVRARVVVFCD